MALGSDRSSAGASWKLGLAFFLQAGVLGLWVVNLPLVLKARDMGWLVAYIGLVTGVCSLIAPIFGALADYRIAAERLYSWLCLAAALALGGFFWVLDSGSAWPWVLTVYALFWCFYAPTWSLLATVCFAHLPDKESDFPKVRAMGTLGWMVAGLAVSLLLKSDESCLSGYVATLILIVAAALAWHLPKTPPKGRGPRGWRRSMGLQAFTLLRDRDQRVFFLTTLFMGIPLAAFYPYTPRLLEWLGTTEVTAWMSLGQITELIGLFTLVGLMKRWRIKWLISLALLAALLRYGLYLVGAETGMALWVVLGLSLHGIAYTFHMVTGQVFLERRVGEGMRGQAQALLSCMAGMGSILGACLVGQWFLWAVERRASPLWTPFWGGLFVIVGAILIYFWKGYGGRDSR